MSIRSIRQRSGQIPKRFLLLLTSLGIVGLVGSMILADDTKLAPPAEKKSVDSSLAKMVQPEYDDQGRLLRPEGFERWIFVGTSLGITYSEGAPEKGPGEFHNVYIQPEAFDYFSVHGEFPEKTIFVMTNSPASKKEGNDLINRHGHFAGQTRGLEVAVKDSKQFDDSWAYFIFGVANGPRTTAKAFPRQDCYDCHAEHGAIDNVFTQFYALLDAIKPQTKRPVNAGNN